MPTSVLIDRSRSTGIEVPIPVAIACLWLASAGCATAPSASEVASTEQARVELSADAVRVSDGEPIELDQKGWTEERRQSFRNSVEPLVDRRWRVRVEPTVRHGKLVALLDLLCRAGVTEMQLQIGGNRPFRVTNGQTEGDASTEGNTEETPEPPAEDLRGLAVTVYAGEVQLVVDGRAHPESQVCRDQTCRGLRFFRSLPERIRPLMAGGAFRTVEGVVRESSEAERVTASLDRWYRGESSREVASLTADLAMMYRWRWLQRVLERRRRLEEQGYLAAPTRVAVAVEETLPVVLLERVRRAFCPPDAPPADPTAPSHEMALEEAGSCRPSVDGFLVHAITVEEE